MNYRVLILLFMLFIHIALSDGRVFSKSDFAINETRSWSILANEMLQQIKKGDYLAARKPFFQLTEDFSSSNLKKKRLHVAAIHVLSGLLLETERLLNRVVPDEEQLTYTATKLQLAFDAVANSNQPLWREYYSPLLSTLQELKQTKNRDEQLKKFTTIYELIQPALIVTKNPTTMEKINSLVIFIQKQSHQREWPHTVDQLIKLLHPLFFGSDEEAMAVLQAEEERTVYNSLMIGILIAIILMYVSWRRYRIVRNI